MVQILRIPIVVPRSQASPYHGYGQHYEHVCGNPQSYAAVLGLSLPCLGGEVMVEILRIPIIVPRSQASPYHGYGQHYEHVCGNPHSYAAILGFSLPCLGGELIVQILRIPIGVPRSWASPYHGHF